MIILLGEVYFTAWANNNFVNGILQQTYPT